MNRFKQIDILRAIAVLLVIGHHMEPFPPGTSVFFHHVTTILFQGGWVGVDLFFVLSGFLVSGLLFREYEKHHEVHIGHFLIRRGFKIYPPFWLLIGVTVSVLALRHQHIPLRAVASELLFVQNYGRALWYHTWSLAVEEHFYLLLACGFFLLGKRRSANPFAFIPAVFTIVALLCLLLRVLGGYHFSLNQATLHFASHLRLDSLFFGVLLSYAYHRHPISFLSFARRFRYLLAGLGALLLLPAFCLPLGSTLFLRTYGFTLFYLGSGCFLVAALGSQAPTNRVAHAVAFIGSHSYSVYLWHVPVAVWGTAAVGHIVGQHNNWFVHVSICLVGSIAFGVGMAVLIEYPFLRFRDRLFPSRVAPSSPDATGPYRQA